MLEAAGRRPGLVGTVEWRVGGVDAPRAVHDSGGHRPPAALPGDARRRRSERRARGVVARSGARAAWTAFASTRWCSRTSVTTTSICTGRWRSTSSRSGLSSLARSRRLRRSTSTTSGVAGWRTSLVTCIARRSSPSGSTTARRSVRRTSRSRRAAAGSGRPVSRSRHRLPGRFNVANVLGAVAAGLLLDLDEDAIAKWYRGRRGGAGPLRERG